MFSVTRAEKNPPPGNCFTVRREGVEKLRYSGEQRREKKIGSAKNKRDEITKKKVIFLLLPGFVALPRTWIDRPPFLRSLKKKRKIGEINNRCHHHLHDRLFKIKTKSPTGDSL